MANDLQNAAGGAANGAAAGTAISPGWGTVIGAGIGFASQLAMSKVEQRNYRKNQERNFEMSQEAQRNAAPNMVAGYRAAGLNVGLAANGNFTPATATSAPLETRQAPTVDLVNALVAQSQIRNANAAASVQDEQAEKLRLENKKTRDSMVGINHALDDALYSAIEKATPEEKPIYETMRDTLVESPNIDPAELEKVLHLRRSISETDTDVLAKYMAHNEYMRQIEHELWNITYDKPLNEREELIHRFNMLGAEASKLLAAERLDDKQVEALAEQIKLYSAQEKKLGAETSLLENSDVIKNFDKSFKMDDDPGFKAVLKIILGLLSGSHL